jgi:signal transduction histidine kinase
MQWLSFCLGVVVAAPLAVLATVWRARRDLVRARRVAEKARTREHLVELARLTGGLAHEIKNPLSTIKLNLKLLAEEFQHSDDRLHRRNHARLCRLQDEIQRVSDILDDFLKYAGRAELHPVRADLRAVIEELIDFYRPQTESARVVLRASLPETSVPCRMDVGLIKQAILNLMINATQAMPDGGELLLKLVSRDGRAVLEVIDTGPGIEPGVLGRIFDAYFTTRSGGSGLGLPTTRRIVRLHDGDIQVNSELGKGTRFVISLPLAKND